MSQNIWNGSFVLGDTSATTLSAGEGIKLDTSVPGVIGIGTDETVLWSGNATSGTLNESPWNFEKLAFETSGSLNSLQYNEMPAISGKNMMLMTTIGPESDSVWHFTPARVTFNNNNFTLYSHDWYANTNNANFTFNAGQHIKMIKVWGINRISGGN